MAVERRESFAMPAFKRQRLEEDSNFVHSDPAINVFNPNSCISDNLKASKDVFDVLPTDPHNDDSGGDSGFHELVPVLKGTISTDKYDNTPILSVISTKSETFTNENAQKEYNSFKSNEETSSGESSILHPRKSSSFKKCLEKSKSPPMTNNINSSDEEADDVASTISDISGLSDISDLSGHEWKPIAGPVSWVQHQINNGSDPRVIIQELIPKGTVVPDHLDDITLWKIIINILSEPPRRSKLSHINTLDDVVDLLRKSQKVIVLTGAGVSVSSGIPDFRSTNGIYARLSKDFPDLPDPQAMFDIHYFRKDPRPFFKFAKEIYPGQFEPSVSHHFIRLLEEQDKLLRNYSQNIDTLEKAAGITKSITCHGSFATASCTRCHYKVDCSVIQEDIFNQRIPLCPKCSQHDNSNIAVMKPDIVFFGEGLSDEFHSTMGQDKDVCDLLIVMGSSLKVRPVALIPSSIPPNIPQILINREPLKHLDFDVQLLGDCDVIIEEICRRLGPEWSRICQNSESLQELNQLPPRPSLGNKSEVNNNGKSSTLEEISSISPETKNATEIKEDGGSCDCSQFENFHLDDVSLATDDVHSSADLGIEESGELADLELAWQQKNFTIASYLPGNFHNSLGLCKIDSDDLGSPLVPRCLGLDDLISPIKPRNLGVDNLIIPRDLGFNDSLLPVVSRCLGLKPELSGLGSDNSSHHCESRGLGLDNLNSPCEPRSLDNLSCEWGSYILDNINLSSPHETKGCKLDNLSSSCELRGLKPRNIDRSFLFLPPSRYIFPGAEVDMDGGLELTKASSINMEIENDSGPSSDYEEADTTSESILDRSADSLLGVSNVEIDCDNEITDNCGFESAVSAITSTSEMGHSCSSSTSNTV